MNLASRPLSLPFVRIGRIPSLASRALVTGALLLGTTAAVHACEPIDYPAEFSGSEAVATFDRAIDVAGSPLVNTYPGATFELVDAVYDDMDPDAAPLVTPVTPAAMTPPRVVLDNRTTSALGYRQFGPGGVNALQNKDVDNSQHDILVRFSTKKTRFGFEGHTATADDLIITLACFNGLSMMDEPQNFTLGTDQRYGFLGICNPQGFDSVLIHIAQVPDPDDPDPDTGSLVLDNFRYEGGAGNAVCLDKNPGAPLAQRATETGHLSLSVDGVGFLTSSTGTIEVEKPSIDARVRGAYLVAASNPYGDGPGSGPIEPGDILINGAPVPSGPGATFERQYNEFTTAYYNFNHAWVSNVFANVTSIVAPLVDNAAGPYPKRVALTITEAGCATCPNHNPKANIDGVGLAVIWDNPARVGADDTAILLFGSQPVGGGEFNVIFNPALGANPGANAQMGLGISYGSQSGIDGSDPSRQYTTVSVNGIPLTSSAGGEDDRQDVGGCPPTDAQHPDPCAGSLFTIGGLDDNGAVNPSPGALPANPRTDDERYSLFGFINQGQTSMTVDTSNPSGDDNLLFGWLYMGNGVQGAVNHPPTCHVPPDIDTNESTPFSGHKLVTITGASATDPDPGQTISYTWSAVGVNWQLGSQNTQTPTGDFPVGSTEVTLTVSDGFDNSVCRMIVTVHGATVQPAPCTTGDRYLWPPEHKMSAINIVVKNSEICLDAPPPYGYGPATIVVGVTSSEPDEVIGNGDGNTTGDVNGHDGYTSPVPVTLTYVRAQDAWVNKTKFEVRAERQGGGNGRSYCIVIDVPCGNGDVARGSCCIIVPHDQRDQQR